MLKQVHIKLCKDHLFFIKKKLSQKDSLGSRLLMIQLNVSLFTMSLTQAGASR